MEIFHHQKGTEMNYSRREALAHTGHRSLLTPAGQAGQAGSSAAPTSVQQRISDAGNNLVSHINKSKPTKSSLASLTPCI